MEISSTYRPEQVQQTEQAYSMTSSASASSVGEISSRCPSLVRLPSNTLR